MNSGEKTAVAEELKSTGSSDALGTELLTMTDMTEDEGKAEGADLHSELLTAWGGQSGWGVCAGPSLNFSLEGVWGMHCCRGDCRLRPTSDL